jgi:phosphocarrier protein
MNNILGGFFKMKEFTYTITDPQGVHARPAGLLVKEAGKYQSSITIEKDGKPGDAKRIFAVMGLAVKCGNTITVKVDGPDEDTAAAAMEEFLKANL